MKRVLKEKVSRGISINLISTEKLDELGSEKIRFILDQVKEGKVLVLEKGLSPSEELDLIRITMSEIDHDSFIGVETPGFTGNIVRLGLLQRLLGRTPPPRMMVVGPAHLLKTIKKDGRTIQAIILTRDDREIFEEDPDEPTGSDDLEDLDDIKSISEDEPEVSSDKMEEE